MHMRNDMHTYAHMTKFHLVDISLLSDRRYSSMRALHILYLYFLMSLVSNGYAKSPIRKSGTDIYACLDPFQ